MICKSFYYNVNDIIERYNESVNFSEDLKVSIQGEGSQAISYCFGMDYHLSSLSALDYISFVVNEGELEHFDSSENFSTKWTNWVLTDS